MDGFISKSSDKKLTQIKDTRRSLTKMHINDSFEDDENSDLSYKFSNDGDNQ